MSVSQLPVQCYAAAVPLLRRPYQATQIRALIANAPENQNAPCKIALFATSETVMDRFNLICGSNWDVSFEELARSTNQDPSKPSYHYKIRCTVTVFGTVRSDIGEGTASTAAMAEFLARAQSFKRAARWHGPGMCLYAAEEIIMYRLKDADRKEAAKLRVPKKVKDNDTPHRHPYLVKDNEAHVRQQYGKWLTEEGEALFGTALDHQEVAKQLAERSGADETTSARRLSREVTPAPVTEIRQAVGSTLAPSAPPSPEPARPLELEPTVTAPPTSATGGQAAGLPLVDHPATAAAIDEASKAGFTESLARALSNLARSEDQTTKLTSGQLETVANWADVLARLNVPEWMVLKAATFDAPAAMSQERRQARFAKWIAKKASHRAAPAEVTEPQSDQEAANEKFGVAVAALRRTMAEHEYTDLPVTRIAALATGAGPQTRIDWPSVPPATLDEIADLLDCAAALQWSNERLDQEATKAHHSNRQDTGAGRFSAFAYSLRDLAESPPVGSATASQ